MDVSSRFPRPFPPPFASAWGDDRYGLWADLEVPAGDGAGIVQKLRWIEPGRFLMGSPETEAERSDDEGPQHEVTISRGFWLFDTACSQGLWKAVMRSNPSYFQDANRPVETVSWNDVRKFLAKLNERIHGLDLVLPTEAQWEYACRAGTQTPFSFGETITADQVNYDGNHPYGRDKKGSYREETVPVGCLPANRWGLYEMHGNVWEWCADGRRAYTMASVTDPVGPCDLGADRALRGGSWLSYARLVRSAYRRAFHSRNRGDFSGFRCARVQEP